MNKPFYSYHQVVNGMWLIEDFGLSFATESKAKEVVDALNRAFERGKLDKALEIRRALGV